VARNSLILLTVSALLPLLAAPAVAANGVGEAVAVNSSASAGHRALATGGDVYLGDQLVTDANGEAQIKFSDSTRMVVGNNSSLVIDGALVPGRAQNGLAIRTLGGAFRFISGDAEAGEIKIDAPLATIAAQDASFDLFVTPGTTKVLVHSGTVKMCSKKDKADCDTIATPCGFLRTDGTRVQTTALVSDKGSPEEFPYSARPDNGLNEDFRVGGIPCFTGGLSQAALDGALPVAGPSVGLLVIIGAAAFASQSDGSADITTTTNTNQ